MVYHRSILFYKKLLYDIIEFHEMSLEIAFYTKKVNPCTRTNFYAFTEYYLKWLLFQYKGKIYD